MKPLPRIPWLDRLGKWPCYFILLFLITLPGWLAQDRADVLKWAAILTLCYWGAYWLGHLLTRKEEE